MNKNLANIILVFVTLLWGFGFVVVRISVDMNISAGLLNLVRGSVFTFCVFVFFFKKIIKMKKKAFFAGLIAGGTNSVAYLFQTASASLTSPSNTAFFTVSYVVIVPFIIWVFYKKKPPVKSFAAVAICLLGMAILCGFFSMEKTFNLGDVFSLIGAVLFAFSLVSIANISKDIHFSNIAFMLGVTQALGGLIYFVIFDGAVIGDINWNAAILPLLYTGICSSFLAQTGQVLAQQNTNAMTASLIMTFEAVFGSIFSVIFGYDKFTLTLVIGGLLIFSSFIICEANFSKKRKNLF